MKVTIEIDLPKGITKAEAEGAIRRAFDPDWMAEWWHMDDVIEQAENHGEQLTEDEAREVLRLLSKYQNCEVGINWDVIDSWIDHVKAQRKEVA
jgi:hypothetical protein